MKNQQNIYIYMDDSGVLHKNDKVCIYGGIVFTKKSKKDGFIRQYISIINKIKCSYCHKNKLSCSNNCPEIKDTNIRRNHKRWLWNLIKNEFCFAIIVNNHHVNDNIMNDKKSRGRYRDFAQRLIIKKVIEKLIKDKIIDSNKPINLEIKIDQQGTATNTNRTFIRDIKKELSAGIVNFNYNSYYPAIIHSTLKIDLKYVESDKNTLIQASDIIAGETRKIIISNIDKIIKNEKLKYLNVILHVP